MKPGSIEHVEFEIWKAEEDLSDLADQLCELHDATDVVLRALPPNADRMLAVLRRERSLIRRQIDIIVRGLESYDAIRADALREGLRR